MHSIQALAVLATAAVVSAADTSASATLVLGSGPAIPATFSGAVPTVTFALTLPADKSSDDWIGTMTDFPSSYTSTVYTTTVYTVTSCPPVVTNCPTGHVTTETITSTTVICPTSTTPPHPPPPPPTTSCSTTTSSYVKPPPPPHTTYPTTSALTTSYVAPYSANSTSPYVKPTGTTSAKPTQFTGAANVVGGSLGLAAVVAFVVAAL